MVLKWKILSNVILFVCVFGKINIDFHSFCGCDLQDICHHEVPVNQTYLGPYTSTTHCAEEYKLICIHCHYLQ